jgi:hypothetical protein
MRGDPTLTPNQQFYLLEYFLLAFECEIHFVACDGARSEKCSSRRHRIKSILPESVPFRPTVILYCSTRTMF